MGPCSGKAFFPTEQSVLAISGSDPGCLTVPSQAAVSLSLSFLLWGHLLFPSPVTLPFSLTHLLLFFAPEVTLASLLPFIFPGWLTER